MTKLFVLPIVLLATLGATAQESPKARPQPPAAKPSRTQSPPQATAPVPSNSRGSSPGSPQVTTERRIESYLRNLYAWGPDFKLTVAPLKESTVAGLYQTSVDISKGDQKDTAIVYVSKDGRYLVRGEVSDMTADPLAENRSKIQFENSPSMGPASAPITIVEFSDFQCPSCRQLHDALKTVATDYPQVRIVFKNFPLVQIHPWAMTAAIAGRCAYQQSPQAFWKIYDLIFDNQQVISPGNAWQKMLDYGSQAGLEPQTFRACMSGPEATQAIEQNIKEGQSLNIASTPTVFLNGHRLVGPDRPLLDQYIQFEQSKAPHP